MILENIQALCNMRGITIKRLEKETGIANGTIARWGTRSPRVENIKKVADFFDVSVDEMLESNLIQNTKQTPE